MMATAGEFAAFLNERSLGGQFHDRASFQIAAMTYIALVEKMRHAAENGRGKLWRSERLGDASAYKGMSLRQCLNHLPGTDIKSHFVDIIFNRACPEPWEQHPMHTAGGSYLCTDEDLPSEFDRNVVDTSMAELAERRRQAPALIGCLLNVPKSALAGRPHVTVDAEGTRTRLDCLENEPALARWLQQIQRDPPYTETATYPPLDRQTCLVTSRFELTNLLNKERHVYRHLTTGDLYAVDSMHWGARAELEVFDKYKRHKGTADISSGKLRPGTAIPGRYLG